MKMRLGLISGFLVLLSACGGGSSSDGIALGRPAVAVEGLEPGQSVTVRLNNSQSDTLMFQADGRQVFQTQVSSAESHSVSRIGQVGDPQCTFSGSTSVSSSNPKVTHRMVCGASGEEPGPGDGGEDVVLQMTLTLTDANGSAVGTVSNPITATRPGRVRALFLDRGNPIANRVVTFQSSLGELNPSSGTALTDGSGVAQIELLSGQQAGAGLITASASFGVASITREYGFQTAGGSDGGGPAPTEDLALGTGSGGSFQDGVLAVSSTSVGAGSSLNVNANIVVLPGNALWSGVTEVRFSSTCASQGRAEIDSPVNAIAGSAFTSYRPLSGCTSDVIRATANLGGVERVALSPEISISQSPSNSIAFNGATPPVIGLRGSAQADVPETSVMRFVVRDSNGDAVGAGVDVDFEVVAGTGGFGITSDMTGTTNSSGVVSVTVRSGTVPTVGTVRARVVGTEIEGTGSVSVQTGVASQDRFSIAMETLNPAAGNHQGVQVVVSARAADRFGNWVQDGTQINFTTELGDIQPSCETQGGGCSVLWTSQAIETKHFDANRADRTTAVECYLGDPNRRHREGLLNTVSCGEHDRFGRSTITAWAVGEEAFADANGNNIFDIGEDWIALPEAFRDDNETGIRTSSMGHIDTFMDFNEDGAYNQPGTLFRGLGCSTAARDAGHCAQLANVRASGLIVLSTDQVRMYVYPRVADFSNAEWTAPGGGSPQIWGNTVLSGVTPGAPAGYVIGAGGQVEAINLRDARFTVVVSDRNGNAPPIGTTLGVDGGDMDVVGQQTCQAANQIEALVCDFRVRYDGDEIGGIAPVVFQVVSEGLSVFHDVDVTIP
ncbi:MAG: hypothetical protein LAT61_02235 [Alcanivorax sp.]|nr:hypothetical protein [Alcanivorax sp.]